MSHSEIWDKQKCRIWLTREIIQALTPRKVFWNRLREWHARQYEKEGNPIALAWADECLEVMAEVEKEMGLDKGLRSDVEFTKSVFSPLKVIEPKTPSVFGRIKK